MLIIFSIFTDYIIIFDNIKKKCENNDLNTYENDLLRASTSVSLLWSYTFEDIAMTNPALGDVDNDGKLEIAVGTNDPRIYILNGEDGTELWNHTAGPTFGSPALGDVDNDGKSEVIVDNGADKIYAFNSEDGSHLWNNSLSSPSSVALGDIDNDGILEVITGSTDYKVYALNGENGSELWNYTTGNFVLASAAIGDVDNDDKLEVIIGSRDKTMYALNGEDGSLIWAHTLLLSSSYIPNSAALGDIDGDNKLEVIFGSLDDHIYALNGEDGSVLWNYTTGDNIQGSTPALGDIDDDGNLEIIVGSLDNRVYALNGEDGSKLWSYTTGGHIMTSPALGDVDGDSKIEVVIGSYDGLVYAINGEDGTESWNYTVGGLGIIMAPVLGDLDGDATLEVIFLSRGLFYDTLYALKPTPSGQYVQWQGFSGDNLFQRRKNYDFRPGQVDQAPNCIIQLQKEGVEISEIEVGEFFDIYVGDSFDDNNINQVRFSSDDEQDSIATSEWTEWYNWSDSIGDWNATIKIKSWSFFTAGIKEVWVEIKDDLGQTSSCYANIEAIRAEYLTLENFLSYTKIFSAFGHSVTLNLSLFTNTTQNNEVLNDWNVVPDEGYSLKFGFMLEIYNLRNELESLSVPQFLLDFCDIIISDDDAIRFLITLNVLSSYNKRLDEFILDVKDIVEPLIPIIVNPKNKISVPATARWFFDNPIIDQWFHITRGTNQYELKLKGSKLDNPIMAVLEVLDIFFRIDFQLLTYQGGEVIPVKIGTHDFIEAGSFTLDVIKLSTKVARIAGTVGADLFAWVQAAGTSYCLFHKFIFDPPRILKTILDAVFPGLHDKIYDFFDSFESISNWIYVGTSFLDPPSSRLDLALFDIESNLILGYNSSSHSTIQNSEEGFVVGDQNAQFMLIYNNSNELYDLKVINSDLNGVYNSPLNYSMILKQIGSNELYYSEGYLEEGESTSAIIQTPTGSQEFSVNTLSCNLLNNDYPIIQLWISDQNNNSVEIDSIQLYLKGEGIPFELNYEGNGIYTLSNFASSYNENETFHILVKKDDYFMNLISVNFSPLIYSSPPEEIEEIPGYNLYILIFALIGVAILLINIFKGKKSTKEKFNS